jgi:hypothetical protein
MIFVPITNKLCQKRHKMLMTVKVASEKFSGKFQYLPYMILRNEVLTIFSERCEVKYQRIFIFDHFKKEINH